MEVVNHELVQYRLNYVEYIEGELSNYFQWHRKNKAYDKLYHQFSVIGDCFNKKTIKEQKIAVNDFLKLLEEYKYKIELFNTLFDYDKINYESLVDDTTHCIKMLK